MATEHVKKAVVWSTCNFFVQCMQLTSPKVTRGVLYSVLQGERGQVESAVKSAAVGLLGVLRFSSVPSC